VTRNLPATKLHDQSGFTLVELLVATALMLFIVGVIGTSYVNMSGVQRVSANYSEFRTNGRYSVDLLRRELQHAGFLNFAANGFVATGTVATTDYGCGVGFVTALEQPVGGANDSNPYSGSCLNGTEGRERERGDILVIRRLSPRPVSTFEANKLYFRATFEQGFVFLGSAVPSVVRVPVEDYLVQTDVYYISPYTASATESPKVPALYRLSLGAGPSLAPQLLASNVENLQVQYGIPGAGDTVQYVDANNVASTDWANAVSVRVWLLTRASQPDAGFTNTTTYAMGDQVVTAADGFQRELHSFAVQLRR
jgi:type IV pilus assembly protein PilW